MTSVEKLGDYPPDSGRGLYLLECEAFTEIVPQLRDLPGKHFVTFLVADFTTTTLDDLTALSHEMIRAGSGYFCAAGNDCETAHLAFDLACCEFDPDCTHTILTTDHSCESFSDAIWFVLNCAYPVDPYDQDWQATIAICVNDKIAAHAIRQAFEAPQEFSDNNGPDVD